MLEFKSVNRLFLEMKESLKKFYHSRTLNVPIGIYGIADLAGGVYLLSDYMSNKIYHSDPAPEILMFGNVEAGSGSFGLISGSVATAKYVSYKLRNRRLAREAKKL